MEKYGNYVHYFSRYFQKMIDKLEKYVSKYCIQNMKSIKNVGKNFPT